MIVWQKGHTSNTFKRSGGPLDYDTYHLSRLANPVVSATKKLCSLNVKPVSPKAGPNLVTES